MSFVLIAAGLFSLGITAALMQRELLGLDELLNSSPALAIDIQAATGAALGRVILITLGGFASFVLFSSVFAVVLNHRVSGPTFALGEILDQFLKGNYEYKRNLRNGDELGSIHEKLTRLGEQLSDRNSEQSENVTSKAEV